MRLLIVDDEQNARSALGEFLRDAGYVVDEARDGQEALAAIARAEPDLLITDVRMRGMSGLEPIKAVRLRKQSCVVVVVMSVFDVLETERLAKEYGAAAFLAKPVDVAVLEAVIARELRPAGRPRQD